MICDSLLVLPKSLQDDQQSHLGGVGTVVWALCNWSIHVCDSVNTRVFGGGEHRDYSLRIQGFYKLVKVWISIAVSSLSSVRTVDWVSTVHRSCC